MKTAFCLILKALFVLEIFIFSPWIFGYVEKHLDQKAEINFKIYDVVDWTTIITIQMLLNISRSETGQLIEYNMRNIFLGKSYIKCGGEASPRTSYKLSKLSKSVDQQSEMS